MFQNRIHLKTSHAGGAALPCCLPLYLCAGAEFHSHYAHAFIKATPTTGAAGGLRSAGRPMAESCIHLPVLQYRMWAELSNCWGGSVRWQSIKAQDRRRPGAAIAFICCDGLACQSATGLSSALLPMFRAAVLDAGPFAPQNLQALFIFNALVPKFLACALRAGISSLATYGAQHNPPRLLH